jgi:hypothetical protein
MLGAKTIAEFINQLFEGQPFTEKDVWNWCAYGKLPHSKHGAQIVASKARIRQRHRQLGICISIESALD